MKQNDYLNEKIEEKSGEISIYATLKRNIYIFNAPLKRNIWK